MATPIQLDEFERRTNTQIEPLKDIVQAIRLPTNPPDS